MSSFTQSSAATPEQQAQAFEALLKAVRDSNVAHINAVAAAGWVCYDIVITMEQEINRMWGTHMLSAPTITYFITRYSSLAFLVFLAEVVTNKHNSMATCQAWGIVMTASVQLVSILTNGLLSVRVNAFFHGNIRVKWLMIILFVGETVIEIALSVVSNLNGSEPEPTPVNFTISGCILVTQHVSHLTIVSWATNIAFSSFCFSLITYRFLSVYFNRTLTNELARTFLRDGAMLFLTVCGANIANIVLLYVVPQSPLLITGVSWLIGAFSIASCRTILSIRGASRKGTGFTSEYELTQTRGPVAFARDRQDRYHGHRRARAPGALDWTDNTTAYESADGREGYTGSSLDTRNEDNIADITFKSCQTTQNVSQ